ncbi:putative interferon-induced very large GTPase 1-like [Apostichopus japonicus]|uniref:Putative interferon-induced very large GTPase 1-like n=1 Tax=Stichopus japonicus TaxID=307972 RepID=A0A2G8K798_STIJA|nr:putative interferon-induced very large GTPase 1-like [Apostichopus japonicus]
MEAMEVKGCHVSDVGHAGILDNFISKITCYDHRIHQRRLELSGSYMSLRVISNQEPDTTNWADSDSDESETTDDYHAQGDSVSSRDMLYAILSCLDPFLLQDVLMKMSACQLAVPVLMPNVFDDCVDFRLWCLRKISKSWYDKESTAILTASIVNYSLLAVTALKFGAVNQSKSNVLNKLFGISQDIDEHAYFDSSEQDPTRSIWSKGILECAWYLPENRCQSYDPLDATSLSTKYKFEEALALLNLRGDAQEFSSQMKFAVENSFATIVFIDSNNKKKYIEEINEIMETSHVILILCPSSQSIQNKRTSQKVKKYAAMTSINATGLAAVEIADLITEAITQVIRDNNLSLKKVCIAESTEICRKLSIRVDEDVPECKEARKRAEEIVCILDSDTYEKDIAFPIQTCWSWLINETPHGGQGNADIHCDTESATDLDIEQQRAMIDEEDMKVRKSQLHTELSDPIKKFYEGCSYEKTKRQYFLEWLQMLLNNLSMKTLKPLFAQLKTNSAQIRNLSSKINKLNTKMEHTQSNKEELHRHLEVYNLLETELKTENGRLIDKFEDCVGLEHFMRELCQLFEAYQVLSDITFQQNIKYNSLPSLAANMLLSGLPIEILDGDSKSVPIIWVKEILGSVKEMLGEDARLYVISVLGIQSSGKSTLMNSLFGVRFAVSAGRCTRGAFLQLLPVARSLRNVVQCDFIAIVDTEGLRAPEKRELKKSTTQDNELATFALCISDLTLINIGGQTMGEDMTNVLQIAAYAFIRMKEVNLNAECRIIQQFVADVTAEEQNEAAMQSIISTLNEAISEAAKTEGKSHLYRQFSDVFVVQNYEKESDNVQYIPSLWRGYMGAPNYQYGVSVQRLKSNILQCIQRSDTSGKISDFISRMSDVWNAIGKEDFVFSFQNTKEVSLYESFMSVYKNSITPIRTEVIGMQLAARHNIENAESEATLTILNDSLKEIESYLGEQCRKTLQDIGKLIKEEKYESVQKHEVYFKMDLETKTSLMLKNASAELYQVAQHHREQNEKSSIVNRLRNELCISMTTVAEQLRLQIPASEQKGRQNDTIDHFIDKAFENFWSLSYKKIVHDYPLTPLEEILRRNERSLKTSITSETQNTSLMIIIQSPKPLKFYSVSSNIVFDDFTAVNRVKLTLNTVDPHLQTQFQQLTISIEQLAKEKLNFHQNASKSVTKLLEFLKSANIEMGHWNIALYICSRFAEVAQKEHCKNESQMMAQNDDKENKIFPSDFVPITRLESTFCAIVNSIFKLNFETIQMMLRSGETNEKNQSFIKRIFHSRKSRNSSNLWKKSLDQALTMFFEGIGKNTKECHCTEENIVRYCRYIKENVERTDTSVKLHAIAHALGQGIAQFRIYVVDYIDLVVNNAEYCMQFAEPLDFPNLRSKLDLLSELVTTFDTDQPLFNMSSTVGKTFHQVLHEEAQKYSNLPQSLSVLQLLDANFLRDLPPVPMKASYVIHNKVNDVKKNLLAQNLATFSPDRVLTQLTGIIYQDEEKTDSVIFPNDVKCAILYHVAAWILPITAVEQHQLEKSRNVALLINEEKEALRKFFRSFCIEHKEQIVAQAFCNIVKCAIKEGAAARVFPILYSRIKKEQIEFSKKRVFIGHVLIDFCKNQNSQGFTDFLRSFENVGLSWTLRCIANACNNRRTQLLHTTYHHCIELSINEILNVIKETQIKFQVHESTFANWLSTFVETLKTKTRLTCKTADIENMKKFQIVENFSLFTTECINIFSKIAPEIIQSLELPNPDNVDKTISWLLEAPFKLHVSLFEDIEGCKEQCPFCGAVCDKDMSAHEKHSAALHYPQGIKGWHEVTTGKLVTRICTSSVDSNHTYKTKSSTIDNPEYRPYKDYEIDYPNWYIRGAFGSEPTEFWKFVFAGLNETIAERHDCKKGDVPQAWNEITIENAIKSAKTMYQLSEVE